MAPSILSLSQNHLKLLETCPQRFQYIFDQSLAVPPSQEFQEAAVWGSQFHLLMQQQALGMPIDVMSMANKEMVAKVDALKQKAPHLFQSGEHESLRQSEHQRTLALNGYVFTVIYDLVVLTPTAGMIVDWKTYLKPPLKRYLADDWQTRLYLYVLKETTDLLPEQLNMDYWFVRHRDQQGNELPPSEYRFTYSLAQHDQTRAYLLRLTDRLSAMRQSGNFPKTDYRDRCTRCPFQIRCQRLDEPVLPVDLNAIEEIALD